MAERQTFFGHIPKMKRPKKPGIVSQIGATGAQVAGTALGSYLGGPAGGAIGSMAGRALGEVAFKAPSNQQAAELAASFIPERSSGGGAPKHSPRPRRAPRPQVPTARAAGYQVAGRGRKIRRPTRTRRTSLAAPLYWRRASAVDRGASRPHGPAHRPFRPFRSDRAYPGRAMPQPYWEN